MKRNSGFAFHVHHGELVEWCSDFQERVDYIKKYKPEGEIETRLRLFQLIPPDCIPPDLLQARDDYDQARAAYKQAQDASEQTWDAFELARAAYNEAWDAFEQACDAYEQELKALHSNLCPNCPWDGYTIFPVESPYHESTIPPIPRGRE